MIQAIATSASVAIDAALLERVTSTLKQALGASHVDLGEFSLPAGGASSNTVFIRATGTRNDGVAMDPRRVVLRYATQSENQLQLEYDLSRQAACMKFVAQHAYPRVPTIVAEHYEDPVHFFVMDAVDGVPLDDSHRMFSKGPLAEASPQQQRHFYDDCIRSIAAMHDLSLGEDLKRRLQRRHAGSHELERELAWLHETFIWGKGRWPQPLLERAFERLRAHMPAKTEEVLMWGDARPPNMIMRDFEVAACLDWELAGIGPGALDLFWFLELNRLKAAKYALPGFRSDEETVAMYQSLRGAPVDHLPYLQLFAATRMAVMTLRFMVVSFSRGEMANGMSISNFDEEPAMTDNAATRRLSTLLAAIENTPALRPAPDYWS